MFHSGFVILVLVMSIPYCWFFFVLFCFDVFVVVTLFMLAELFGKYSEFTY